MIEQDRQTGILERDIRDELRLRKDEGWHKGRKGAIKGSIRREKTNWIKRGQPIAQMSANEKLCQGVDSKRMLSSK